MTRIAISLPDDVREAIDELVRQGRFRSRGSALAEAARMLARQERRKMYEQALEALDPDQERAEVNAFVEAEEEWPEY